MSRLSHSSLAESAAADSEALADPDGSQRHRRLKALALFLCRLPICHNF
jgi:hypothetical protein